METSLKSAGDGIAPGSAKQTGLQTAAACVVEHHVGLSFCSSYFTRRGRYLRSDHFDVPAEADGYGYLAGSRAFAELAQHLQSSAQPLDHFGAVHQRNLVFSIIKDAAVAADSANGAKAKRNAARGLLFLAADLLAQVLREGCGQTRIDEYLQRAEADEGFIREYERKLRAAFVERMRQAKAAKRLAAQEVARHG